MSSIWSRTGKIAKNARELREENAASNFRRWLHVFANELWVDSDYEVQLENRAVYNLQCPADWIVVSVFVRLRPWHILLGRIF